MDGSNPFFADVRVRRAMTMACDVERMRRDLTYNLYEQSTGIYHPTSWMYPKQPPALLPFDLDGALLLAKDPFDGARYEDGYLKLNEELPGLGVTRR
jgi:ABC-type oligopeptide transport system substrate-binding subunit